MKKKTFYEATAFLCLLALAVSIFVGIVDHNSAKIYNDYYRELLSVKSKQIVRMQQEISIRDNEIRRSEKKYKHLDYSCNKNCIHDLCCKIKNKKLGLR